MSRFNLNRVVLVGRLTRDPDLRALPSGTSVCTLRVASNTYRKEPDGTYGERPNYFDVDVYGVSADTVSTYMRRGSRVGVDGRLEWREWETAQGGKRQAVSIVADTVQFLDGPGERSESHGLDGLDDGDGDEGAHKGEPELVGAGAHEDISF